jgi:ankyrin repeat protein
VLCELVCDEKEDVATYYATRSDAKDVADGSTLCEASRLGYLTVVRCILERGTETVDEGDGGGWTPLHWASLNGHVEVVKALLAAKAEVNKSIIAVWTPLYMASLRGTWR